MNEQGLKTNTQGSQYLCHPSPPRQLQSPYKHTNLGPLCWTLFNPQTSPLSNSTSQVLKNPYIWGMALTYFFIYVVRQGVTSWFVFYLIKAKGLNDAAEVCRLGLLTTQGGEKHVAHCVQVLGRCCVGQ